jgi:para-nitrobenzyl esterase
MRENLKYGSVRGVRFLTYQIYGGSDMSTRQQKKLMVPRIFHLNVLTFFIITGLISFLCPACSKDNSTGNHTAKPPVVETQFGPVKAVEDENSTWVWKAIQFAKPPVGELRWKAPIDPEPWEEVREKTEFCSDCVQYSMGSSPMGNEDCLYLNIWRPRTDETNLPVYFWIHGGGNSVGSAAFVDTYYGANLAHASNMIFVSVNYRLGPFGWFTHPSLRSGNAGNEKNDSGNYGTLDLIKALEWIRDNIEAFGGDPGNITITGESAGAFNVFSLMISPAAEGLFHRALAQSGATRTSPVVEGETSARDVILKLLVNDETATDQTDAETHLAGMTNTDIKNYLMQKSSYDILACYEPGGFGMITFPSLFEDGAVIPESGFDTFETGTYSNKVPIMLGTTKEETKLFLFMESYFDDKDELYQIVTGYGSDNWKAGGVDEVARKLRSHADQPGVYAYQFLWGAWRGDIEKSVIPDPWGLKLGSCHSLDIPFFLGTDSFNGPLTGLVFSEENRLSREALTGAMMAYTARFARTGNPNESGSSLPLWKAWSNDADKSKCILLDADLSGALNIQMSTAELTSEDVKDDLCSMVSDTLYLEALNYLGWECN